MKTTALLILIVVSAFYAYGALVHVANMASLTGFDWPEAPLKWRVLDVVYLAVDVVVAIGLWRRLPVSVGCFFIASLSQIALYTIGRDWILDVPTEFQPSEESVAYLGSLVAFHVATLVAVSAALALPCFGGRRT